MLQYRSARQDVPPGVIIAWSLWGQPTTFWLGLRPAPQEGIHACYFKPGQKPMAGEARGLMGKTTTVVLLNGHVLCQAGSLFLYSYISVASTKAREASVCNGPQSVQRPTASQRAESECWVLSLKQDVYISHSPLWLRESHRWESTKRELRFSFTSPYLLGESTVHPCRMPVFKLLFKLYF